MSNDRNVIDHASRNARETQPQLPVRRILFFSLILSAVCMIVIGTLMLINVIPIGLPAVGYILYVIAAFDLLMGFVFFRKS